MKMWLSKKKDERKVLVHLEDEIDYEELNYSDRFAEDFHVYKMSITEALKERLIDQWIEKYGADALDKFDSDELTKEFKREIVRRMISTRV